MNQQQVACGTSQLAACTPRGRLSREAPLCLTPVARFFSLSRPMQMFQLLLPQIAEGRQLILLYIMCAIAPLMKLATSPVDPDSKHAGVAAR